MNPTTLSTVAQLSNDDLLARVKHLAGRERAVTAVLIAHLAELDARRLYLAEGCASVFTYCTQILHLSEHAAYGRIEAARASRKFPVVLAMLNDGSVNLSTVCLLAPHLTSENYREVLDMAQHKTKRQVEEMVARLRPQPPVPDVVQFTASAALHEKLRQAQALLRHQIPDGDLSKIFDRALTALLQDLAKKKLAATERPRASQGKACGSRHIPAEVRRAVWSRDGGRCAFVADTGRRCTEEAFLEFHHVVPHAAGGAATAENIQLRCRAHNGYAAARDFGRRRPLVAREARASYVHMTGRRLPTPRLGITAGNSVRTEFEPGPGPIPMPNAARPRQMWGSPGARVGSDLWDTALDAHSGVERVPDRVPQRVEAQHGQHDRHAGERDAVRGEPDVLPRVAEHRAPLRSRWLRPQAEEAQRGGEEYCGCKLQCRLHDDHGQSVG